MAQQLKIEVIAAEAAGYGMQCNRVPLVKKLEVSGDNAEDMTDLRLEVRAEPDFLQPVTVGFDLPGGGEAVDLTDRLTAAPRAQYFASLGERVCGKLVFTVYSATKSLATKAAKVELLAFDEWQGSLVMPELTAAFVMPGYPQLSRILARAGKILGKWTGNAAFDAYRTQDPNRVRFQAAAIYETLAELGIRQAAGPGLETVGQRIRLADALLNEKQGTSLELALLYCACLEAAGLNAILVLFESQALAGVWLADDCFPECVTEDASLLTKKSADGISQLCVIDCAAIAGERVSYDRAERMAGERIAAEDGLASVIDIQRARALGIRPLPLRQMTRSGWELVESEEKRAAHEPRPVTLKRVAKEEMSKAEEKRRNWERKLLDLGLKNLLLNLRVTMNVIPLIVHSLSELEDALVAGKEYQIFPAASEWYAAARDKSPFELGAGLPFSGALKLDYKKNMLRAAFEQAELDKHLNAVYRACRQSMEENGANTLYLAMGYLRWFESEASVKPRYAPLVLVPLEMVRRSAQKGYAVRLREDEATVNVTLLEMLKQDFKKNIEGLDPLPKDGSGVDMKLVFSVFREAVMDMPNWDVVEAGCIGIFSFNKFIMWQSLRTLDGRQNVSAVARALESGTPLGNILAERAEEPDVEAVCERENILLPVDADASQAAAVVASERGDSFVLHGPPGTGKSQTITNIIANALFKGKRVLFVAEKMAALEVVQRRLEAVGLGPFCLELHSTKANKTALLAQFKRAVDAGRTVEDGEFARVNGKLNSLREGLSAYVGKLYQKYPFGMTLYDAIARYFQLDGVPDSFAILPKRFASLEGGELARLRELVSELTVTARAVGHPYRHALSDVTRSDYSVSVKTDAELALTVLSREVKELAALQREVDRAFGGRFTSETGEQADLAVRACRLALSCRKLNDSLLKQSDIELSLRLLKKIVESKLREIELVKELLEKYTSGIYDLDARGELAKYRAAGGKWLLARKMGRKKVKKALKRLLKEGQPLRAGEVEQDLIAIDELKKHTAFLNENMSVAVIMLGSLYRHDLTDWQEIMRLADDTLELLSVYRALTGESEAARELVNATPAIAANPLNEKLFALYEAKVGVFHTDAANLSNLLGIDFARMTGRGEGYFAMLTAKCGDWQRSLGDLREWCAFLQECEKAEAAGLGELALLYRNTPLAHEQVSPIFERAVAKGCILYILDEEEGLNTFSSELFASKVAAYRDAYRAYQQVSAELVRSRLAEKLPNFDAEANAASELGVLQRAIKNGGRGISIRKLFSQMPNLLPNLAPCMLMSPISVAQYLDAERTDFDLVIFDEASQMPTYEAVVPLSLAKQIVVVGDPKQLPPTTFFMNNFEDEEDFFGDDLESVLDDLLALGLPERHLLWHYRSRHESLIAFSNRHYYDGQLYTFPSPDDLVSEVKFVKCAGVYERGGTKQNRAEAEAVVAEVVKRLSDSALARRSIGIVTFSSVQQNLIEDLLQAEFKSHPNLEQAAYRGEEPLFVKNLENVQGDERDVIIFSIGYGKDRSGRLSLNFGPLNREGGYRRLNVAVSRAKYEMMIFSSLDPEDINAARTNAAGVINLKAFLEYAKYGRSALTVASGSILRREKCGIEQDVALQLRKRGYEVKTNVGASKYKVDVAVVNPRRSGEYILGVMCDGETYRGFSATRDREVSQYKILQGLGWNVMRVWSLDYLDNRDKVINAIVQRVGELINGSYRAVVEESKKLDIKRVKPEKAALSKRAAYRAAALPPERVTAAEFISPEREKLIVSQMKYVLSEEAPVTKSTLFKRVLAAHSIARLSPRVTEQLERALAKVAKFETEFNGSTFYWAKPADAAKWDTYRVMPAGMEKRPASELPYEELRAAIAEITANQVSLQRQDLVREVLRALDYSRAGDALNAAANAAIERAITDGTAAQEEGRIRRG